MKKSKLKSIPIRERKEEKNTCKYTVESELAKVDKDTVLILNLYLRDNRIPDYRIFFSKNDYITEENKEQQRKWLTGMVDHYTESYWNWSDKKDEKYTEWSASPETITVAKKYLKSTEDNIYDVILKFQQEIKEEKKEASRRRYTDPIDKKMENIKAEPPGFLDWIKNDVLYRSRYIYYQYAKRKKMAGYCTHCCTDITVEKARHNETGICPRCGCNITYKAIGKSTKLCDREKAALIQKVDGGFVARYYDVLLDYRENYRNPKFSIYENKRVFYTPNLIPDSYVWSNFKNECVRWIYECDEITGGYSNYWGYSTWRGGRTVAALYTENLNQILQDTDLKHSEIWSLAKSEENYRFDVENFIRKIKDGNQCIEKLIKCGLFNLARDEVSKEASAGVAEKGKTLNKILGVQNDDAKIILGSNPDEKTLGLFKKVRSKLKKRLTAEQMIEIMQKKYSTGTIHGILNYTSAGKALRYLNSQTCSDKDQIYMDYLDMCMKLKMDTKSTFVLFPRNLKAAHDVNVELINEKENQKTYAQHNSKYAAIKKLYTNMQDMFGYENEKYFIRPPVDAAEIVKEGQKLHHCVGGGNYSLRMVHGEIAILFLREKKQPEIPYYTIEVDMKTYGIRQYHGYKNRDIDKSQIAGFINNWKKNILNKLAQNHKKKVG